MCENIDGLVNLLLDLILRASLKLVVEKFVDVFVQVFGGGRTLRQKLIERFRESSFHIVVSVKRIRMEKEQLLSKYDEPRDPRFFLSLLINNFWTTVHNVFHQFLLKAP